VEVCNLSFCYPGIGNSTSSELVSRNGATIVYTAGCRSLARCTGVCTLPHTSNQQTGLLFLVLAALVLALHLPLLRLLPYIPHPSTLLFPKRADGRALPGVSPVVEGMTMSLAAGSRCLLIGPNGAGKTTLLKILGGKHMVPPSVVTICGSPPFHDTQITSSGDLTYLGGNWTRDIAFAGYSIPLQARCRAVRPSVRPLISLPALCPVRPSPVLYVPQSLRMLVSICLWVRLRIGFPGRCESRHLCVAVSPPPLPPPGGGCNKHACRRVCTSAPACSGSAGRLPGVEDDQQHPGRGPCAACRADQGPGH
jgi:ABC transporter